MKKHFLILGGYGGVGKEIARSLILYSKVDVTISGRNLQKAIEIAEALKKEFPGRVIEAVYADATDQESLIHAFQNVDLVIVAATTPDFVPLIAEAAIRTGTNWLDIFVRSDVVEKLEPYLSIIEADKLLFITQGGFHPGLIAPFVRYAANYFDDYQTAKVGLVMNEKLNRPDSAIEIIHEVGNQTSTILKNGEWRKATYKDGVEMDFGYSFGKKKCYPLQMKEMIPLKNELGIQDMGMYAAGFNPFIDHVVFPFTMLLQSIQKGLGIRLASRMMYWGSRRFFKGEQGVIFRLEAEGLKNGEPASFILNAIHKDGYVFTAYAVMACLKQYLDGKLPSSGIHLMGHIVDPELTMNDLKEMGVRVEVIRGNNPEMRSSLLA